MKILHITPHMGGGVGSVLTGWMDKVIAANDHWHRIVCLDYANDKAKAWADKTGFCLLDGTESFPRLVGSMIADADIILCHYWDSPFLADLFADPIPDCRLAFWVHKHYPISEKEIAFPDKCIGTSPIQFLPDYIWSTGNMSRFLAIKPKKHKGFNVGYVGTVDYKKMHPNIINMCDKIDIPDVHFIFIGDTQKGHDWISDGKFTFTGKVDDVTPYLTEMDVFGYPLRPDHYGTAEQSMGEAMAAGIVPVCMDNLAERLIIQDSESGLLAKDEKDYIKCIKYLYNLPSERQLMSDKARIHTKYLYSLDTMIPQWNNIFNDMMKKPKTSKGVL